MIVGLTGKMGSGKTTVADHLVSRGFTKVNFKDGLVEEMKRVFPNLLNEIQYEYRDKHYTIDDLFLFKPPLMRALMQNYGTEVRRGDNPNYWVDKWMEKVREVISSGGRVVTDDVRFLNEAKALKDYDGFIIKIERTDITDTGTHTSEIEMNSIKPDYVVSVNKGEHEILYKKILEIIDGKEG